MADAPSRYLYLVDEATDELVAICPADGLDEAWITRLEAELAVKAGVDDPESNMAIRDSQLRPLADALLQKAWASRLA